MQVLPCTQSGRLALWMYTLRGRMGSVLCFEVLVVYSENIKRYMACRSDAAALIAGSSICIAIVTANQSMLALLLHAILLRRLDFYC